jgi:hypothetical protein
VYAMVARWGGWVSVGLQFVSGSVQVAVAVWHWQLIWTEFQFSSF